MGNLICQIGYSSKNCVLGIEDVEAFCGHALLEMIGPGYVAM